MIQNILDTSKKAPFRTKYQVLAKLMEEVGELATEVNIDLGYVKKPTGTDGIIGEALDVINCAVDLIYLHQSQITAEQLEIMQNAKLKKWISTVEKKIKGIYTDEIPENTSNNLYK